MSKSIRFMAIITFFILSIVFSVTHVFAEETTPAPVFPGSSSSDNIPISIPVAAPTDHLDERSGQQGEMPSGITSPSDPSIDVVSPPAGSESSQDPSRQEDNSDLPGINPLEGFPDSPSDELLLEQDPKETELPLRPSGNWFTSAWFLILLLVLLVLVFLLYIAFTEGRWPAHKTEISTKKQKKSKK